MAGATTRRRCNCRCREVPRADRRSGRRSERAKPRSRPGTEPGGMVRLCCSWATTVEILVKSLLAAAERATGSVAVIDVFRAFTTAAVALGNGASRITMVGTVEEALALRSGGAARVCMGEVRGRKPADLAEMSKISQRCAFRRIRTPIPFDFEQLFRSIPNSCRSVATRAPVFALELFDLVCPAP